MEDFQVLSDISFVYSDYSEDLLSQILQIVNESIISQNNFTMLSASAEIISSPPFFTTTAVPSASSSTTRKGPSDEELRKQKEEDVCPFYF